VCKQSEYKSLIDTLIKTANFICGSALNDHEQAALLEEVANENGVKICRATLRWLILWICFERIILFVECDEIIHRSEEYKY
jgi:hypothetical protein